MTIHIHGARQNNLAGVDVSLPRGQLTVVTGVSGSGKSSLAFDTLYAEGQRRYVESFSTYARQFLERKDRPDVDRIDGLLPAVALEQKNTIRSARSTLGTLTELTDYLKVLFARLADPHCPVCGALVRPDDPGEAVTGLLSAHPGARAMVAFPFQAPTGEAGELALRFLVQQGWRRVIRQGKVESLDAPGVKPPSQKAREAMLVDRFALKPDDRPRLVEAVETAYRLGDGEALVLLEGEATPRTLMRDLRHCGRRLEAPTEGLFSFNSPQGACEPCKGFGRVLDVDMDRVVPNKGRSLLAGAIEPWSTPAATGERKALKAACEAAGIDMRLPFGQLPPDAQRYVLEGGTRGGHRWKGIRPWFKMLEDKTYKMHVRIFLARYRAYVRCETCSGSRFRSDVRNFRLGGVTLPEVLAMTVTDAGAWLAGLPDSARARALAPVTRQLATRLGYLGAVGLGYLTLDRAARTLSGGEVQRANLTTTLGSGLVNTLFVLDEPTVGLHAEDASRLSGALADLVARDNTVVVVEHDPDMLRVADHVIEMGPGPGAAGGRVLFSGPPSAFRDVPESPTLQALARRSDPRPLPKAAPPRASDPKLTIRGARAWNLKDVDVDFPVGRLSVVTGVSGSGKSTLVEDVLHRHILRSRGEATDAPGACREIKGLEHFSDVIQVDQSAPQASSRAIPVTWVGAWDWFRNTFARTPLAKSRGYTASTFSFNAGNGRCPACEGVGFEQVEMQFLADVRLTCELCEGTRFRREVLDVTWQGKSVSDVLALTVDEAVALMKAGQKATLQLEGLRAVGLGYLRLGQPLATLSGGEAQRLKLAEHLMSARTRLLFLLDEPTTGLHLNDVDRLIGVFGDLVARGHTVICVEHHLDVVAAADHVIDLGPEGGDRGGRVVFAGPPAALVKADTATGRHLARWMAGLTPLHRETGHETRETRRETLSNTTLALAEPKALYGARGGDGWITVEGARTHNLREVSVQLPRAGRTVVSGVSGSGKSTLVFDIIFAEGQRRFLDCLSVYARQYIEQFARPDADRVEGIPPTVAIEQRTTRGGSRSNVSNVTEIDPFLRILFARLGTLPAAGVAGGLTVRTLAAQLRKTAPGSRVVVAAPVVQARQGMHETVLKRAASLGYDTLVDGVRHKAGKLPKLRTRLHHDIDYVLAEVAVDDPELVGHLEEASEIGQGQVRLGVMRDGAIPKVTGKARAVVDAVAATVAREASLVWNLYQVNAEPDAGTAEAGRSDGFDPRYFSYRTQLGRCEACEGWGSDEEGLTCKVCDGERLGPIGRSVRFGGRTFPEVLRQSPGELVGWLNGLPLSPRAKAVAEGPLRAISERVSFLDEVGLGYLGLDRAVRTLSGGEAQRIRLAAQLGAHLSGVLYVLDEPTIGLHPTDTARLLATLDRLEARGNGILMVEHDETTLRTADMLIDIGPGAGVEGGQVLAAGPVSEVLKNPRSLTGRCLAGPRPRVRETARDLDDADWIAFRGIAHHTLKQVDVRLPRGRLVAVTGVSGSGKSSLVEALTQAVSPEALAKAELSGSRAHWKAATGLEGLTSLTEIDDQPIGKNPRSTPATYVGVWDAIRGLFAGLPEARVRGYTPGRFSFNVSGGRCEACSGNGLVALEMSFLPEAWVECPTCRGRRFSDQTLQVLWEGRSIHDVLTMPIREALEVFGRVPAVAQKLRLLVDVGLGYLTLGQPSPTLSGGEAQRIKLVTHLAGRGQPKTVIILDEPSIGLHMADVPRLLEVLHRLVDKGATVIVVEHNLDLVREADWVIDMGPGPGEAGGLVVYAGPVAGLAEVPGSLTGQAMREAGAEATGSPKGKAARRAPRKARAEA